MNFKDFFENNIVYFVEGGHVYSSLSFLQEMVAILLIISTVFTVYVTIGYLIFKGENVKDKDKVNIFPYLFKGSLLLIIIFFLFIIFVQFYKYKMLNDFGISVVLQLQDYKTPINETSKKIFDLLNSWLDKMNTKIK